MTTSHEDAFLKNFILTYLYEVERSKGQQEQVFEAYGKRKTGDVDVDDVAGAPSGGSGSAGGAVSAESSEDEQKPKNKKRKFSLDAFLAFALQADERDLWIVQSFMDGSKRCKSCTCKNVQAPRGHLTRSMVMLL